MSTGEVGGGPGDDKLPGGGASPALLSVDGLVVRAAAHGGTRTIVRDVSFRLGAGETLGIVGESGSGKTMTARSIAGVLPEGLRAGGRVTFEGRELVDQRGRELRQLLGRRIGMVLQDPFTALNPLQTIGEHLRESLPPGRRRGAPARGEVARRLAEVGLDAGTVAAHYP
ncbi:MAG TPA: ATP-binding cassette domain-containing protein, partial [Acidimicrobiales bacterium]|nr:ATP-binding cassette domain-containing protein [Acidimicrobiales bacterium]